MEQTYYMIRTKDASKYLAKHVSRYGTSINLSKDKKAIIEAETLDDARYYLRRYLAQTSAISPADLEIIKAKKIIAVEETYPAFPNTIVMCSSEFGYALSTQEAYDEYPNCLGPNLETAKTKLTKEVVCDLITKYLGREVKSSFEYKLKKNVLFDRDVDIEVTNVSFK